MNLNKVKYLADILYGYGHRGTPKENAKIFKTSEGDYVVSWTEDGFLKQDYLTPEEYTALVSERDQKRETREYVYTSTLEDKKREEERQKEEERKERTIQREKQEEKDKLMAVKLLDLIKEINYAYDQIQAYKNGYVLKIIRDYEQLEVYLNTIKTESVKKSLLNDLAIARNDYRGTVSMGNAMGFIKEMQDKVEENPEHYKTPDLKRAQREAKKRFDEMTATEKIRHTKERASFGSMSAAELDKLFQKTKLPPVEEEIIVNEYVEKPKQTTISQDLENLTLEQLEQLKSSGQIYDEVLDNPEAKHKA